MRFNLNHQANLTAWGAAACMRQWRITGEHASADRVDFRVPAQGRIVLRWEKR